MIGGQHLDLDGAAPDDTLHRLKTGRLFAASVATALWVAGVAESAQTPWRRFGEELGPLFQLVDDILDGDGVVLSDGVEEARRRADAAARRAADRLRAIPADTSVLGEIVAGLAARTA
jgi:geranylgeranyl pyrophosphate synthase